MKINDIIICEVVGFQDYGVFVKCGDYDGLVHISEVSEQYVLNLEDIFELGDNVSLKLLDISEDNKLKLSYKQAHETHKRILKNVRITKGFQSLKRMLLEWLKAKGLEDSDEEV